MATGSALPSAPKTKAAIASAAETSGSSALRSSSETGDASHRDRREHAGRQSPLHRSDQLGAPLARRRRKREIEKDAGHAPERPPAAREGASAFASADAGGLGRDLPFRGEHRGTAPHDEDDGHSGHRPGRRLALLERQPPLLEPHVSGGQEKCGDAETLEAILEARFRGRRDLPKPDPVALRDGEARVGAVFPGPASGRRQQRDRERQRRRSPSRSSLAAVERR